MALLRYPLVCVLLLAAVTVTLLWQTRHLHFDNSAESFLRPDHPERLAYLAFEDRYGLSAYFVVLLRDPELFTVSGLTRLQAVHAAIEAQVPHVSSIESLSNTRFITSEGDDIWIEPLFSGELDQAVIDERKASVLTTPYYLNRLVNPAADAAAIIVRLQQFASDARQQPVRLQMYHLQETLTALEAVVNRFADDRWPALLVGGSPTISVELTSATREDMLLFSLLGVLMVAIMLYLVFRRWSAVFLPLLCLLAVVAIVLSCMAIGRYPLQVSSAILPSFLMAVCVADAIHFLRAFYAAYDQGAGRYEAIRQSLAHVGMAMFFTTLTTSVGLLSFAFSDVAPVASFGLFASFGVWVALLLMLVALPALLLLFPLARRQQNALRSARYQVLLARLIDAIARHAKAVPAVALIVLAGGLWFASQLSFSHNPLLWFDRQHPVREANRVIESTMAGAMQVEMLISRQDGRPLQHQQLQQIDQWLQLLRQAPVAGVPIHSAVSVLDMLKEANRILQPEAGYRLADNQPLLAQQLLLLRFDPANSLDQLIDQEMREMRVTLSIPWMDSVAYTGLLQQLERSFNDRYGHSLQLELTGMATVANRAFTEMIRSMMESYLLAGVVILLLMLLLVRRFLLGLALVLPNLLPIVMVLALMQLLSIPLDLFTMLIGSIAIGLIVDDSIHFVYSFRQIRPHCADVRDALVRTLVSTGSALLATTLVLCFGFLIYCFSSLQNLMVFGLLTALCIALALVADVLLIPAILLGLEKRDH